MALSSLFYGMEAYLDGDITINNNIDTPEDEVAAADQSAEIASDVADASTEAKDNEIQAQMLVQMSKLYTHVKTYGIDRTFLSIYNSNHELDRMCGTQFPSCESMPVTGNPHDQYSARFITAMEDDNKGLWNWIKNAFKKAWEWIKEKASWIWSKITGFWDWIKKQFKRLIDFFKRDKTPKNVGEDTKATVAATKQYTETVQDAKVDKEKIAKLTKEVADLIAKLKETEEAAKKAQNDAEASQQAAAEQQRIAEEGQKKIDELNKELNDARTKLEQIKNKADADKQANDIQIKKLTEERNEAERRAKELEDKQTFIKKARDSVNDDIANDIESRINPERVINDHAVQDTAAFANQLLLINKNINNILQNKGYLVERLTADCKDFLVAIAFFERREQFLTDSGMKILAETVRASAGIENLIALLQQYSADVIHTASELQTKLVEEIRRSKLDKLVPSVHKELMSISEASHHLPSDSRFASYDGTDGKSHYDSYIGNYANEHQ